VFGDVRVGFLESVLCFHGVIECNDGEEVKGAVFVTGVGKDDKDVGGTRMKRRRL
jgi:hypothetical protein